MLRPSGVVADQRRRRSRVAEQPRRHACVVAPLAQSTTMRAPAQRAGVGAARRAGDRGSAREVVDGRHARRVVRIDAARPGRPRSLSTARSKSSLNFSPRAGEDLDAVVLERIVRRGDHDAGVEVARAREVRDGRRRHARRRSTTSRRRTSGAARELALDPVAGLARVAPDQQARGAVRRVSTRTSAAPTRRTVAGSSGALPALPRTPSVPNRRGAMSSGS